MMGYFNVPNMHFWNTSDVSNVKTATFKHSEWFWGVILASLLEIGCVESNPGPRASEMREKEFSRRQYGSMENRHGGRWPQEEIPAGASVCWPFVWWCKGEPLPDEESLIGSVPKNRARRGPNLLLKEESDDELLRDHQVETLPAEIVEKHQQSESKLEVDLLKQQIEHLKYQLEREVKQRREEKKMYEENTTQHKKLEVEARRLHDDLHSKLDEELVQKSILEKQIQQSSIAREQNQAKEQVEIFNKEFQRRKQLEEELEREIQEHKQVSVTLQQEVLKRQQIEQDLRLQGLNRDAELKERAEQNQEQELQRRQLQLSVEQELQKRQELLQQLEHEMKQRQELQRKLLKETQERNQLELQLQEEAQVRHELELEFKQADLQSQILEQELRQQLRELKRLLNTKEDDEIEIIPTQEVDEETSATHSTEESEMCVANEEEDEIFDEVGQTGNEDVANNNDNANNDEDDDEKQEIRQLLLEEFQRLQIQQSQAEKSAKNLNVTEAEKDDKSKKNEDSAHKDEVSDRELVYEEVLSQIIPNTNTENNSAIESFLTELEKDVAVTPDPPFIVEFPDEDDEESKDVRRIQSIVSEYDVEEDNEPDIAIRRSNVLLATSPRGGDYLSQDISQRRKGIILKKGLSLGLEEILEEFDSVDYERLKEKSLDNDYSHILDKIVSFRGRDVSVAALIGENVPPEAEVLLEAISKSLSNGKKLVIGAPNNKSIDCYMPRTLYRNVYVRYDILTQRTSKLPTVFAISGMTKRELQEIVPPGENISKFDESSGIETAGSRLILLNEKTAESDYNEVCKRARNFKSIHWLSKQPDGLVWKKSKGHIDVINQYLDVDKREEINSVVTMKEETVILTGFNGDGKSTYLTNLVSEINEIFPAVWVIRVNLNEHMDSLGERDFTQTEVIELLSSAAGLANSSSSELGKDLLKYSLQITGNVVVLVDEISPSQRDKVHGLLTVLKSMKIKKLVIGAHSRIQRLIENLLSTLVITLKPLDRKEQRIMLAKFWNMNPKITSEISHSEFSDALLHLLQKSFANGSSPTPLDIKMLADTFEGDLKLFLATKVTALPQHFDVLDLYERYVELKRESYTSTRADKTSDRFSEDLTRTAMLALFPEETVNKLLSGKAVSKESEINCHFLHRNLENYITAKWFTKNYQNNRTFIEENYFKLENQTMWAMFDRILAKNCETHKAVLNGNVQGVKDLLSRGSDINSLDTGGRTALHLAILQGKHSLERESRSNEQCAQIASILIDHNADVSITDNVLQWTALRYADIRGTWPLIDTLLKKSVDMNDMAFTKHKLKNYIFLQETLTNAAANGLTHVTAHILDSGIDINTPLHSTRYSHQQYGLLHIASENGHVPLLEFLLENQADVNGRNCDNNTPLHLSSKQGKQDCVLRLLENDAHINQTNKTGDTPLHEAVRSDHSEIVKLLLDRGADVDIDNKYGDTPLHVACHTNKLTAVSHLIDKKADKTIRNRNGDTSLDCAIRQGHSALVRYILGRAGGNLSARERDGRTPLHLAAVTGDVLALDYLLQVMPDVNVRTAGGDTPLHLASLHGKTEAVVFLLNKNSDINSVNNYGNTPLHLSSVRGNISSMNALIANDANVNLFNKEGNTSLHLASLQGKPNAVRSLIEHRADVNIKNREKNTALQLAVKKGDFEVIRMLIDAKSDVNVAGRNGSTILHQVAGRGKVDIVKLLLDSGRCYLDIRNSQGDSPLLVASRSGYMDVVECLKLAGADINFLTSDGNAPIHIAVMSGNFELVTRLQELGADLNVRNFQGNTPLHRAVYAGNDVMIRHLVDLGVDKTIQNGMGDTPFDVAVQIETNDTILQIL